MAKPSVFKSLETRARALDDDEIKEQLRALASDPRFPAVVGWLLRSEHEWKTLVASSAAAPNQASLAAAAGGMDACMRLRAHLRQIVNKERGVVPPSPGD